MRILLCNDDGYFAPGIEHLARALADLAEITVVAPERDRSGASNSLTLDRPLVAQTRGERFLSTSTGRPPTVFISPSPACSTGFRTWWCRESTWVPTWATTRFIRGPSRRRPRVFCSAFRPWPFRCAARVPASISRVGGAGGPRTGRPVAATGAARAGLAQRQCSRCALRATAGTVVTRLGKRHKAEPVVRTLSPRNETVYWVGAAGGAQDAGEGTDFHAVRNHQVSVTPLQVDLTHNAQLALVRGWLAR
jgi:5'-nucleotidase